MYEEYLIEGEKLVIDTLNQKAVITIVASEEYYSSNLEKNFIREAAANNGLSVFEDKLFEMIKGTENTQGIIAVAKKHVYGIEEFFAEKNRIILLDRLQDPGNVGNIIRTAKATNHKLIFIKGTVDPYSPKVARAAMSALSDIPILLIDRYEDVISLLKQMKIIIIGADANGNINFQDMGKIENTAIVIGNEANGISCELMEVLDKKVSIPMEKGIESLNAATAAGLMMYRMYLGN